MGWDVLLFDLDGTLTDSGPGIMHAAETALGSFGITTSAPAGTASSESKRREYAPKGSMCTPTSVVRSVPVTRSPE